MRPVLETERITKLKEVTERLNHYEAETPGIPITHATSIADTIFPVEKFTEDDVLNTLSTSINSIDSTQDHEIDESLLAISLCAALSIISRYENIAFTPHLILWGKYLSNQIRFNLLALQQENLPPEDYIATLKDSKILAKNAGWNDMEAMRTLYEYLYCGGWYYYPEMETLYPKPIGSSNLNIYQLVTDHFLLSFPRDFTLNELHSLLLGEVEELKEAISLQKQEKVEISFEAADVFIYLIHIASKKNLSISELIEAADKGR